MSYDEKLAKKLLTEPGVPITAISCDFWTDCRVDKELIAQVENMWRYENFDVADTLNDMMLACFGVNIRVNHPYPSYPIQDTEITPVHLALGFFNKHGMSRYMLQATVNKLSAINHL